jgi:hypothetical protein
MISAQVPVLWFSRDGQYSTLVFAAQSAVFVDLKLWALNAILNIEGGTVNPGDR